MNIIQSVTDSTYFIQATQMAKDISAPRFISMSGATCGIVAAERVMLVIKNVFHGESAQTISENMACACFYGLCAFNIIPGSAALGTVTHLFLSLFYGQTSNSGLSRALHKTVVEIANLVLKVTKAIWNDVVVPLARTLRDIASAITGRIPLPSNPMWYATALLICGIGLHRFR